MRCRTVATVRHARARRTTMPTRLARRPCFEQRSEVASMGVAIASGWRPHEHSAVHVSIRML